MKRYLTLKKQLVFKDIGIVFLDENNNWVLKEKEEELHIGKLQKMGANYFYAFEEGYGIIQKQFCRNRYKSIRFKEIPKKFEKHFRAFSRKQKE